MVMRRKSVEARVKAVGDESAGEFEAVVSVFGNVDSYGDVVLPGAFAESLKRYAESGKSIPAVFSHGSQDVGNFIGRVTEAKETDEGLYTKVALYLDADKYGTEIADRAKAVRQLMHDGVLSQFSFAYGVDEWQAAKRDGVDVIELKALSLYEIGPTLVGANQETRLVGVKADGVDEVAALREELAALTERVTALEDAGDETDPADDEAGTGGDEVAETETDAADLVALEADALRAAIN